MSTTQSGTATRTGTASHTRAFGTQSPGASSTPQGSSSGSRIVNPPNKTAQAAPESTEVSTPPHDMDSQTLKAGVTAVAIFVVIGIFAYNHWWPTNHIALFQPKDDGGNIVIDIGKNQPPPDTTQSDTGTKPAVNKATTPSSEPTMGCWLDGVQLSATEVYHCPD